MEAGEAAEARASQARAEEAAELTRARLAAMEQQDRVELHTQGFLSREVAAVHAEAEARRQGRIVELRAELDRLTGQSGRDWRPPGASDVDRVLADHRRGLAEWDSGPVRRQRVLALEGQAARERLAAGPVAVRTAGELAPPPAAVEGRVLPPLTMPAGLLPADDHAFGDTRRPAGPPLATIDL
jgi:hypothetical protein